MHIDIVPATLEHACDMAPNMRQQDAEEVWASGGYTPLEALLLSVANSAGDMRWSALYADVDKPFCMWGAAAHVDDPNLGVVWLLGTDVIYNVPRQFVRESRRFVSKMHERFPVLANYVDARNTASMKWLETLGFKALSIDQHHGHERRPFILYASYN